jgi:hypothetical protein
MMISIAEISSLLFIVVDAVYRYPPEEYLVPEVYSTFAPVVPTISTGIEESCAVFHSLRNDDSSLSLIDDESSTILLPPSAVVNVTAADSSDVARNNIPTIDSAFLILISPFVYPFYQNSLIIAYLYQAL